MEPEEREENGDRRSGTRQTQGATNVQDQDADVVMETNSTPNKNRSWKDRLMVIKLLGRNIGYATLQNKIHSLWKPSQPFPLMDIENGEWWKESQNWISTLIMEFGENLQEWRSTSILERPSRQKF
ncbi:hypothetical protein EPI10_029765 [Gossypium australe]|uniref:DUF4283 domain-containing protein n=1 Tax=Gossypium australe TaxID=47621 RepID=A0A5B6WXH7_9ROSI|nr:hypothetical protein EPI10_029765 [Gossypium australe]